MSIFTFGQSNIEKKDFKKWTFGTIIINENNWSPRLRSNFIPNFFPGVIAKYNLEQFSLRLGIEHTVTIYKPDDIYSNLFIKDYKRETLLRLGIEKGFIIKQFFRPTVALDIFASKSYHDTYSSGGITGNYFQSYINSFNIGVRPTIGIEFILSESFSISLESNYDFKWSKSNCELTDLSLDEEFQSGVFNIYFNSVNSIGALSLNYHF
jgi:hypothetical protein